MISYKSLSKESHILFVNEQQLVGGINQSLKSFHREEAFEMIGEDRLQEQAFYYLGEHQNTPYYTTAPPLIASPVNWVGLRSLIHQLSHTEFYLASRAVQLHTYHRQHQFCGQCGQPTRLDMVESAMACEPCSMVYYPRISPCMMCLIIRGEYCLLAHHDKHPEGLYTALAGFVEAGESIEQTVQREVREEVGLKVKNLQYFSSQSWPFPHQLMVSYFAEYDSGDVVIDDDEITDAHWFHYSQLPEIPSIVTLSGQLIQAFVKRHKQV